MSCLNPIRLPYLSGQYAIIPCGKCPECLRHKSNELTVRIVREVETVYDFYFLTLTYDQERLPIAMTEFDVDYDTGDIGEKSKSTVLRRTSQNQYLIDEFFNNADFDVVHCNGKAVKKYKPYFTSTKDGKYVCLYHSVCNSDVQKFMKRVRKVLPPGEKFKYILVPEYGSNTFRPHYHLLLLGMREKYVNQLADMWRKSFGFVDVKGVFKNIDDVRKVSKYISTYSYKGNPNNMFALDEGYCVKPHRCTSANFGIGKDFDKLTEYLKCEDIYGKYDVDDEEFISSHPGLVDDVVARRVYSINGFHYPVPKYIQRKIFWKDEVRFNPKTQKEEKVKVSSALQRLVTSSILGHIMEDVDRKSGEYERSLESSSSGVLKKFSTDVSVQEVKEQTRREDYRQTILLRDKF